MVESFKTALFYWGLSEYTACSTERLDVLTNEICICSSTEKLNKTGTSLVSVLYKNRLSIKKFLMTVKKVLIDSL